MPDGQVWLRRGPSLGRPLGLPEGVTAGLFDLDGVLTDTAAVHDEAWKSMFDAFLRERAQRSGQRFVAFDPVADYAQYVDGKPRPDGVRDFLASRGIRLPDGDPDDGPDVETVHGLGNRKNEALLRRIHEQGVEVFEGSRRYLAAAQDARPASCRGLLQRQHGGGAGGHRLGPVGGGLDRRHDDRCAGTEGQAGAGHVPGRSAVRRT